MVIQVTLDKKFKYGIKRTCRSCGVNFYDLDKQPSECPNCGAIYELHVSARHRKEEEVLKTEEDLVKIPFDIKEDDKIETTEHTDLEDDDPFDSVELEEDTED